MRSLLAIPLLSMSLFLRSAGAAEPNQGELHYRAVVLFRGETAPRTTRFVLMPTAVVETRNKVKKPRLGSWRLESERRKEDAFAQTAVLARMEKLLYLSGPGPALIQKPIFIRYEDKRCQVWQVEPISGVHVYAYLVEVAPGLLALSYLSGTFSGGDMASVELQLEHFRLLPGAAPAENGTVLLNTLRRLGATADTGTGDLEEAAEAVE